MNVSIDSSRITKKIKSSPGGADFAWINLPEVDDDYGFWFPLFLITRKNRFSVLSVGRDTVVEKQNKIKGKRFKRYVLSPDELKEVCDKTLLSDNVKEQDEARKDPLLVSYSLWDKRKFLGKEYMVGYVLNENFYTMQNKGPKRINAKGFSIICKHLNNDEVVDAQILINQEIRLNNFLVDVQKEFYGFNGIVRRFESLNDYNNKEVNDLKEVVLSDLKAYSDKVKSLHDETVASLENFEKKSE